MHSNRVHNINVAPASWLASNINANAKRRFLTKFTNPKTSHSGDYHFRDVDSRVEGLKISKSRASSKEKKSETNGNKELDENDPLTIELNQLVAEELAKPQSRLSTLNLGISGLQYVFDSKQPWYCKLFWLSIIVSCFSVCSYQLVDRVSLYLRYPIATEIEIIQNQTILFPVIIACPVEIPKLSEINLLYMKKYPNEVKKCEHLTLAHLIGFEYDGKKLTAEDVWNLTDPYEQKYFNTFSFQDLFIPQETAYITDQRVVMFNGVCIRVEMNQYVDYHGIATQISFFNKFDKTTKKCYQQSLKVLLMDTYDPPDIRKLVSMKMGARTGLTIIVKQHESLDAPNNPCQSSESYKRCHQQCSQGLLDREISCKLPYMPMSGKPMCETSKDALKTQDIAEKILLSLNVTHSCGCVRKCIRVMYSLIANTIQENTNTVNIHYASNYFEIVKESYSYDWLSLLCDIGGNLGLYLGLSVLSVFEIVQSFYDTYKHEQAQKLAARSK